MKAGPDYGKANNKSVYLFSIDRNAGKVAHVNFVPQELVKSKKLDAKIWLEEANKVLGGKVNWCGAIMQTLTGTDHGDIHLQGGGKPDSAMGSGNNVDKVGEAITNVLAFYKTKVEGA